MPKIALLALAGLWILPLVHTGLAEDGPGIRPGRKVVLSVELTKRENRWIKSSGLSAIDRAKVGIAIPEGFDPEKAIPILVTCVTGDPYVSNIEEMDKYWPLAASNGWITVTGWSFPRPERDTRAWRRAVTVAAMRKLADIIPESRKWPVAVAGFSGGAKNAAIIAAFLQREGYSIRGLFMGGCNQDTASHALKRISRDKEAYRDIPVFLSCGTADPLCSLETSRNVKQSMEASGIRRVRIETYPGGHLLHQPHIPVALQWFTPPAE